MRVRAIGVDTGPVPGLAVLDFDDPALLRVEALQCSPGLLPEVLEYLLQSPVQTYVQVERFVVGRRAARSGTSAAGQVTRDLVGQLQRVVQYRSYNTASDEVFLHERSAAAVKPWATDARLVKLTELCPVLMKLRHARDAARHALFTAVHDGDIPDPLSKEWRF